MRERVLAGLVGLLAITALVAGCTGGSRNGVETVSQAQLQVRAEQIGQALLDLADGIPRYQDRDDLVLSDGRKSAAEDDNDPWWYWHWHGGIYFADGADTRPQALAELMARWLEDDGWTGALDPVWEETADLYGTHRYQFRKNDVGGRWYVEVVYADQPASVNIIIVSAETDR